MGIITSTNKKDTIESALGKIVNEITTDYEMIPDSFYVDGGIGYSECENLSVKGVMDKLISTIENIGDSVVDLNATVVKLLNKPDNPIVKYSKNIWNKYISSTGAIRPYIAFNDNDQNVNKVLEDTNDGIMGLYNIILGTIAEEYDFEKTYKVGRYCIYSNSLWKCKMECEDKEPDDDSLYWEKTTLCNEINNLKS